MYYQLLKKRFKSQSHNSLSPYKILRFKNCYPLLYWYIFQGFWDVGIARETLDQLVIIRYVRLLTWDGGNNDLLKKCEFDAYRQGVHRASELVMPKI